MRASPVEDLDICNSVRFDPIEESSEVRQVELN